MLLVYSGLHDDNHLHDSSTVSYFFASSEGQQQGDTNSTTSELTRVRAMCRACHVMVSMFIRYDKLYYIYNISTFVLL